MSRKRISTVESEGHLDLKNSEGLSTLQAHIANRNRRVKHDSKLQVAEQASTDNLDESDECPDETDSKKRGKKRKRLSAYQVAEIVLSKRLRNRTKLLAFSNQQRQEGKTDLAEFIVNRGKKAVNEVIATAWELESAQKTHERLVKLKWNCSTMLISKNALATLSGTTVRYNC